jgi:membrane-bound serine protease (ClpP class)
MQRNVPPVLLLVMLVAAAVPAAEVVQLRVDDTIQPASQRYIERVLSEAEAMEADLVVLELDTPGGLLDTTRDITTAITESRVPVVVFVSPGGARAASAGFFILLAADIAAMTPGTNTGAAHPVSGQGQDLGEDIRDKATNDAAAMIRAIASQRGRNVEESVKAVTESTSYTAEEALEADLVDLVAGNLDELLNELDGREITRFDDTVTVLDLAERTVVVIEPTSAERFLSVLANPNIAYLLMALGMLGIYVEVTHPGAIFPGVVGVISILLALYSLSVLPVNLAGIALIMVALVLFLLEVKIVSYGLLTIAGIISFVIGSLMLFDAPIPDMRVSLGVVLPTALLLAAVAVFLLSRVVQLHRRRPVTGEEGLVGKIGHTLSALDPYGKVKVHGEYWDARSTGAPVAERAEVRVVAVSGRRIDVEPVGGAEEGSAS